MKLSSNKKCGDKNYSKTQKFKDTIRQNFRNKFIKN